MNKGLRLFLRLAWICVHPFAMVTARPGARPVEKTPPEPNLPPAFSSQNLDAFGGLPDVASPKGASGFFRVERIQGRWWFVTPAGHGFYSIGVNQMGLWEASHDNRKLFRRLYATQDEWLRTVRGQIRTWGFNTIGNWAEFGKEPAHPEQADWRDRLYDSWTDRRLYQLAAMPFTPYIQFTVFGFLPHFFKNGRAFDRERHPDVFSAHFRERADVRARFLCEAFRDNPWLVGYFLGNENSWTGHITFKDGQMNVDPYYWPKCILKRPGETEGKRAFAGLMQRRYGNDIRTFNSRYRTTFRDFREIAEDMPWDSTSCDDDMDAFMSLMAEEYFKVCVNAIRRYDKHHLILGDRIVGGLQFRITDAVLAVMGKYCDVISGNFYADHPDALRSRWERWHRISGRPLLVSEFGYLAFGRQPYPKAANQQERGEKYAAYVRAAAEIPYIVGTHLHAMYDMSGANWGLINPRTQKPYTGYVDQVREANATLQDRHQAAASDVDF